MRVLRFLSFARGQYLRGPRKPCGLWGEEKFTLGVSNRRKVSLGGCERIGVNLDERLPLAKYKIQLAFLAVSQCVRLHIFYTYTFLTH